MSRRIFVLLLALVACRKASDGAEAGGVAGAATYNADPDSGVLAPQLLVEVQRLEGNQIVELRFTADGRWLLALDGNISVWELDGRAKKLTERGWFGLAADREEPALSGSVTPENAFAIQAQIEDWKKTHASIKDFELLPSDRMLACADDGSLSLWSLRLGETPPASRVALQHGVGDGCYGLAASADGRWAATFARPTDAQAQSRPNTNGRDWQGVIQLWSVEPGTLSPTALALIEDMPGEGVLTRDGAHLVVVGSSQTLVVLTLDGKGGMTMLPEIQLADTAGDIAEVPSTGALLLAGFDHRVTRMHLDGSELVYDRAYAHHRAKVGAVVPSSDGGFFVASSPDKSISLWPLDVPADRIAEPVVFSASDDYVHGIDLHPVGPYLATANQDLRIWAIDRSKLAAGYDTTTRLQTRALAAEQPAVVIGASWRNDDVLTTIAADGSTVEWSIADGRLVEQARAGQMRASLTPARDCVLTGRADGRIDVSQRIDGALQPPTVVDTGLARISTVLATPDATRVLIAGTEPTHAARLTFGTLDATTCLPSSTSAPIAIPATPSGDVLSSSSYPGGGGPAPEVAEFSRDGAWLLTAEGNGGGALLWRVDASRGTLVHEGTLLGHHAGVDALAFSPDARHAITTGGGGEIVLHRLDLASSPPGVQRLEYLEPPVRPQVFDRAVVWSPSGRRVAIVGGHRGGHVWIFDLAL